MITTMTTVGFGDIGPATLRVKRWVAGLLIILTGLLPKVIGDIQMVFSEKRARKKKQKIFEEAFQTKKDFIAFDEDGDGEVNQYEFLTTMLVKLKVCEQEAIDEIAAEFQKID